jgi:hypothetical protein
LNIFLTPMTETHKRNQKDGVREETLEEMKVESG